MKSITAVYNGPTVSSISEIKAANFTVTGTYDDGSKKTVTGFGISMNSTVTGGKYTVTITSGSLSTTVQVPTTDTGSGTGTSKNATGITATTTLPSVEEGYSFKDSDFDVKYVYSDGSTAKCGAYSISYKLQSGSYIVINCRAALTLLR